MLNSWPVKLLSRALLNCHEAAASAGHKFALEEFTSGRNRLENEGARAMAEVFEVRFFYYCHQTRRMDVFRH